MRAGSASGRRPWKPREIGGMMSVTVPCPYGPAPPRRSLRFRQRLRRGESMADTAEGDSYRGRLRFGMFMAPFHPAIQNPTLALERDLELIELLERLDFDEVWVGEHHSA